MELKSKFVSLLFTFTIFAGGIVYSQGLYDDSKQAEDVVINDVSGNTVPGDLPNHPGGMPEKVPVGEGLAILSLLSGGYVMFRRSSVKKHEV
jgi:hypothetical protein